MEALQIDFSQLIEACLATLSELYTRYVDLTLSDPPLNLTGITYLDLLDIELTPSLARILKTNFPKLSTLALYGSLTTNLTISLPSHDLEQVDITTTCENGERNGYLIKTTFDNNVQYHSHSQTDGFVLHGKMEPHSNAISTSREELDDPLLLTFICASVKDISLTVEEKTEFN